MNYNNVDTKQKYVVGLMFSHSKDQVALIRKTKPKWQEGKLNGISGKVEENETVLSAMIREFEEETGLKTEMKDWRNFADLEGNWGKVIFYVSFGDLFKLKSTTEEKIEICNVDDIYDKKHDLNIHIIPNLKWLIPMALDKDDIISNCHEGNLIRL